MKLIILVAFGASQGASRDPWFSSDKLKHFAMGAFVQSVAFSASRSTGLGRDASIAAASLTTVGVGGWKERRDRAGLGTPSGRDFLATIGGGAAITPLLLHTR